MTTFTIKNNLSSFQTNSSPKKIKIGQKLCTKLNSKYFIKTSSLDVSLSNYKDLIRKHDSGLKKKSFISRSTTASATTTITTSFTINIRRPENWPWSKIE